MNVEPTDNLLNLEVKKTINTACRMLAIREHSTKQLQLKLKSKGYSSKAISESIDYLQAESWQSDERFCEAFIRSRVAKGQGLTRIEHELRQQAISSKIIAHCLAEERVDWLELCKRTASKKLQTFTSFEQFSDENELSEDRFLQNRIKLERFLRYRGFALDDIRITINQCLKTRSPVK